MGAKVINIYRGKDPRDLPAYSVAEAAWYLRVHFTTLYSWLKPVETATPEGYVRKPIIGLPQGSNKLSFLNLVEGHIVRALRVKHRVSLSKIRTAIEYSERKEGIPRLLISGEMRAGAGDIFIKKFGELIDAGQGGQLAMEKMLEKHLERVEYDNGSPISLFPFVHDNADAKVISISPYIAFGKPVVSSKSISTRVLTKRFDLGESSQAIAADYDITEKEVEEAILYESAA